MFRPFRRLALAVAGSEALVQLATERDFSEEDRNTLLMIADSQRLMSHAAAHMEQSLPSQPDGVSALDATAAVTPDPAKPRPFIYWLTHGGAAWLYGIAQIIAAMFGFPLPKLPPLPQPPPLKPA